jgi:hypothetical protein
MIGQDTDFKSLIIHSVFSYEARRGASPRPNSMNRWRDCGRDGVTIGKQA